LSGSRPDARRRSRTPRLAAPPRRDPAALRARRARCFFSSRRRHTRSKRDWSSDVCSSDLPTTPHAANEEKDAAVLRGTAPDLPRSEERRVGKEWRSRRGGYPCRRSQVSEDVSEPTVRAWGGGGVGAARDADTDEDRCATSR